MTQDGQEQVRSLQDATELRPGLQGGCLPFPRWSDVSPDFHDMFLKTGGTASSGADGLWEGIVALVTHKNKKRELPTEGGGLDTSSV